jgi:tetratricopeptide (TPR) repeat protein
VDPPRPDPKAACYPEGFPAAAELALRLRRLAGERALRRFAGEVRTERCKKEDPAPWVAAALGLADPRKAAPKAVRRAERLVRRLQKLPAAERESAIRSGLGGATNPALPVLLIEEARRRLGTDPRGALAWIDLGGGAVHDLRADGFPECALAPHRFRLAAHRANTLRVLGELPAADRIFRVLAADPGRGALAHFGDRAELWSLEASLRIDQRRWGAAERALAQAESAYAAQGDGVGVAKVLLQRGTVAEYSGESERALEQFTWAAQLLNAESEPSLLLASRKNQAIALVSLGRAAEAGAILVAHRGLLEEHGDAPLRQRWRWTEARIAGLEGRFDQAAAAFAEVCTGFLGLQRPYDAALVLVDAAELHLARGH